MAARTSTPYLNVFAAISILVMGMIMQAQEGLSARESKYCDLCGTLQCPETCPDFNNGNSKSLCHIDCQTCTTECKQSNGTSSTPQNSPPPPAPASSNTSTPAKPPPPSSSSNPPPSAGTPPPPPPSSSSPPATSPPTSTGTPSSSTPPSGSPGTSGTPNSCNEKGAICKDPRFIGGDGNLFYFHGKANEDFCIVTDSSFHMNAHFIGKSVEGRPRDFTWVQAIGMLYGSHKVSIGAKKQVQGPWDDDVEQMEIFYDDEAVSMGAHEIGEAWESPLGDFKVARSRKVNSVSVEVRNLLKASINVTYVDEEDSKIHKYGIDVNQDCFAHLDLHCTFLNLSSRVDGVLGQTYKPTYQSLVKAGVPMPTMGGYDTFKASSIFSADCSVGVFDPSSSSSAPAPHVHVDGTTASTRPELGNNIDAAAGFNIAQMPSMSCTSGGENGFVCRR